MSDRKQNGERPADDRVELGLIELGLIRRRLLGRCLGLIGRKWFSQGCQPLHMRPTGRRCCPPCGSKNIPTRHSSARSRSDLIF